MTTTVVVGAGIAGLAAAWELQRAGLEVIVLESERRAGGVILTERRDGFVVEGGPDGWLAAEPDIPALANELGIAGSVVEQAVRGSFAWTGRVLEPLPEGRAAVLLGIPTGPEEVAAGFRTFTTGMAEIVEALVARLGAAIRSPLGLTGIRPNGLGWDLAITGGSVVHADGAIFALPTYGAGRLLEAVGVGGARRLGDVTYAPSLIVSLAYRADQVGNRLQGTGFVATAPGRLRACTYASAKFPGRAPPGHVLLRAFLGDGDGDPAQVAHAALAPILGLRGAPAWARVFQWSRGIPRYGQGHAAAVTAVRERITRLAPLALCGAGYDGAGVSACVRSGRVAGREMVSRLVG